LIRLGFTVDILEVQKLRDILPSKDVMASIYPQLMKSKCARKGTGFFKAQVGL
jgi:hypothetical protein